MLRFTFLSIFSSEKRRSRSKTYRLNTLEDRLMMSASAIGDHDISHMHAANVVSGSRVGSSPFTPDEESNSIFVVDAGPGLDTGCTFRSGGPFEIEVEIDRYFGDIQKLRQNGLLPEFVDIKMPAFDVDYSGSGSSAAPERDRVSVNGHVVPGEFLGGENNEWKLNSFRVPTEWLKLPSTPGAKESNVIRIDIDTANAASGQEQWCTAIDWVQITVDSPAPVFFVHGILSDSQGWEELWMPKLAALGLPVEAIDLGGPLGIALDSIESNASKIATEIDRLQSLWGFHQINIVGHSKGGLDAREYIERLVQDGDAENDDLVSGLFQIGTPNQGSPLADYAQTMLNAATAGLNGLEQFVVKGLLNNLLFPAGQQLTTTHMESYNSLHGSNPNTKYVSLAGNYDSRVLNPFNDPLGDLLGGLLLPFVDDDSIVPVSSVHALSYASHLTFPSTTSDGQASHFKRPGITTGQVLSQGIYDMLSPLVLETGRGQPSRNSANSNAQRAAASSAALSANSTSPATRTISSSFQLGQTRTHTLKVDATNEATFTVWLGGGDAEVTLVSPSGRVITAAVADADPNIDFLSASDPETLNLRSYKITNPEAGTWQIRVRGLRVDAANGKELYFTTGWMPNSQLKLETASAQSFVELGTVNVLTASLTNNGAPLVGGSVTARIVRPDGTVDTQTMYDDGTHGDPRANDGRYTLRYDRANLAGQYQVLVDAVGSTYERQSLTSFVAAVRGVDLGTTYSSTTADSNANGLFDALEIHVPVSVTAAGTYSVVGQLQDSQGRVVADAVTEQLISVGDTHVTLSFSGKAIYESGLNGPYKLHLVRVGTVVNGSPTILEEAQDVYTTGALEFREFEHAQIQVISLTESTGIDTNNNNRFDQLRVRLGVDLNLAGNYQWSARLIDRNGIEIGFAANGGSLASGLGSIELNFDGLPIGEHRVDGPYFVTDLLINGPTAAVIQTQFETSAFLASQFEGGAAVTPTDLDLVATSDTGRLNDDDFTGDDTPTIRASAPTGSEVKFFVDGVEVATATEVVGSPGVYEATLPVGSLQLGDNSITATADGSDPSEALVVHVGQSSVVTLNLRRPELTVTQPDETAVSIRVNRYANATVNLLSSETQTEVVSVLTRELRANAATLSITGTLGLPWVSSVQVVTNNFKSVTLTNVNLGILTARRNLGTLAVRGTTSEISGTVRVNGNLGSLLARDAKLDGTIIVNGQVGNLELGSAAEDSVIRVGRKLNKLTLFRESDINVTALTFGSIVAMADIQGIITTKGLIDLLHLKADSDLEVKATRIKRIRSDGQLDGTYQVRLIDRLTSRGAILAEFAPGTRIGRRG